MGIVRVGRRVTLACAVLLAMLLLLGPLVPAHAQIADDPVPRGEVAERCGLDPDLMLIADALLASNPYVVLRHGELCWQGGHELGHQLPLPIFSVTKTFGAVLVGAVAARSSLDDTTLLTDWLDESELGDVNPQATVAHVLAMTGTDPDLSAGNRDPWTYDTFGDREIDLLVEVVDRVIAAEPDGFDGAADSVAFAQDLFDLMGMTDTTWPGGSIGAGMTSTPLDMARLGELLLRRGMWGDVVVMDEAFAYRTTHPAFEDSNTGYGYLTYLNAFDNWYYSTGTPDHVCSPYAAWPHYPHAPFWEMPDPNEGTPFDVPALHDIGVVWASGAGGQRIVVHRGLDLVIALRDSTVSTDLTDPGVFEGHKSSWAAIRPALVALDPVYEGDEDAFCDAYRRGEYAPSLHEPWSVAAVGGSAPADQPDDSDQDGDVDEDTPSQQPPLPATGGGPGLALLALLAGAMVSVRRS